MEQNNCIRVNTTDNINDTFDSALEHTDKITEAESEETKTDNEFEDFFSESSLKKVKTRSELRPDILSAMRNLLLNVEVIKYSQAVLFCTRMFGINPYAASKTIDEIARSRNISVSLRFAR